VLLPFTDGLVATHGFDPEMAMLADRHYSRRTPGARQFLYSGRRLVLRDNEGLVLFGWMWPDEQYRMDDQSGFYCAIFRNESLRRGSEIIVEAESAAFAAWGPNRMYTYVDPTQLRQPEHKYRRSLPGYCFLKAGWKFVRVSTTGKHLLAKELSS
jgi:hypothetical protein